MASTDLNLQLMYSVGGKPAVSYIFTKGKKQELFLFQILLLFIWAQYKPPKVDDYEYPAWANNLGLALGLGPLIALPLTFCIQLCRTPGSGLMVSNNFI